MILGFCLLDAGSEPTNQAKRVFKFLVCLKEIEMQKPDGLENSEIDISKLRQAFQMQQNGDGR